MITKFQNSKKRVLSQKWDKITRFLYLLNSSNS